MDPVHHRFLYASYLQKSIRRGLTDHAHTAATQLYDVCQSTFNRRMAIIALEDIGLGHPPAIEALFNAENFKDVVDNFCKAPKNRDASKLCQWAKTVEDAQFVFELGFTDAVQKAELLKSDVSLPHKLTVLKSMPFEDALVAMNLPQPQRDALIKAHAYRITNLALAYALLYNEASGETPSILQHELPPVPLIQNVPAWAYDMHTSSGKAAIKRWQQSVPALANIPLDCVSSLLFAIEGGAVTPQAVFSFSGDIKRQAFQVGWPTDLGAQHLARVVMEHLERLHDMRQTCG